MKEIDVSKYYQVPFAEKGRDFSGCDCWGLVFMIYKDLFDIELPSYHENYHNLADAKLLASLISKERRSDWERVDSPNPGDAVLMRLKNNPMHVGIYIGNKKFIHCVTGSGTVIEKINSVIWRDRIVGFFKYKK